MEVGDDVEEPEVEVGVDVGEDGVVVVDGAPPIWLRILSHLLFGKLNGSRQEILSSIIGYKRTSSDSKGHTIKKMST